VTKDEKRRTTDDRRRRELMPFKFERLEVWQLALEHIDLI